MTKRFIQRPFIAGSLLYVTLAVFASGVSFAAEISITRKNTSLRFELDSTWHKISGNAPVFHGTIEFDDPSSPSSISGFVNIDTALLETGNSIRDRRMRGFCLDADRFPDIRFKITGYVNGKIKGQLTIKNITRAITVDVTSQKKGERIEYQGATVISWKEFGVADPSWWFAKVAQELTVTVIVAVPIE